MKCISCGGRTFVIASRAMETSIRRRRECRRCGERMGSIENYIENSRKSYTPIGYVTEEDAVKAVTNAVAEAKQKYADALLESITRSDAQ